MDISLNQVDLQYLTNPLEMAKVRRQQQTAMSASGDDINFYRTRIFRLTKAYLTGEKRDPGLDEAFCAYASECVKYFRFLDKSEIIQSDYKNVRQCKKVQKERIGDLDDTNRKFLTTRDKGPPRITDHLKIVRKTTKPKLVVPKTRTYELKNERFRTKPA